mgnify:CR=1 FL=1
MSQTPSDKSNQKLWGGRFAEGTDALVEAFTESVSFDRRLWRQDIAGSQAHARMLGKVGVLTAAEVQAIVDGLDAIRGEIAAGGFQWQQALEDVHMNIESALTARIGEAGKKLHTGRSRNDQVATDLRLYTRDAIDELAVLIEALAGALLDLAEREADSVMPGFTHLQIAQPVSFGHHMLAWREQILRDRERLRDARKRTNRLPLGSAALAGTVYPIDRHFVAEQLGFDGPTENSLDSVSDRDFAIEFCAAASLLMVHLSRWSEELILWSSPMFGFVKLPDRFCTGSSIMPQKKNPDAAELVRAKTGRINGALIALTTVMKGLPLAYSKDMQEDKEQVFDAAENLELAIAAMTGMVSDMTVNVANMKKAAGSGYSTATDLADWLVRAVGLPFREAHHVTGRVVALAESKACDLSDLPLDELQAIHPAITNAVYDVVTVEASVASRKSFGGTAPDEVRKQIAWWRARN